MQAIKNNPYRTVGLLAGATTKEQSRQIGRLKQYIQAEQAPQDDFSFPVLGELHRTLDRVEEATSKLNLDSDKINAALFWFWNGDPSTDEVAFDALKSGHVETASEEWRKLVYTSEDSYNEVTGQNASAFHNLSTLYLSDNIIDFVSLRLKLMFLESDFVNDFTAKVADETFKITKKELQLLFLNNLSDEETFETSQFLEAVSGIDFLAKEDFLRGFAQKYIEQIEQKTETAKNKRRAGKAHAAEAGQELFTATKSDLSQLKSIVGLNDLKYASNADKVANEILQCSIDYFNDSQEKESSSDYTEIAMKLAKDAESLAIGDVAKERIKDSIHTLAEMKDRELSQAIAVLQTIKTAYETHKARLFSEIMKIRLLPGQSVNWDKVNETINNSFEWEKAVEIIQEAIPLQNVEKIEKTNNPTKVDEYKTLVNFMMGIMSGSHKGWVKYIQYWETKSPVPNFAWAKWCLGIAIFLLIVGLIWGKEGLDFVFGIAAFLGLMFLVGWLRTNL